MLTNPLTGEPISNDELQSISQMVHNQKRLELDLDQLQEQIAQKAEQLKSLSEVQIPEAMSAIGLSELKLSDESVLSVSKYYSCRIPEEQAENAFAWLRKTGNDDIIKNEVKLSFGKGEDDLAQTVAQELVKRGLSPEQKIYVHPMTLKSFVRERIESAQELPQELFGVFVGNKTKITMPKKAN